MGLAVVVGALADAIGAGYSDDAEHARRSFAEVNRVLTANRAPTHEEPVDLPRPPMSRWGAAALLCFLLCGSALGGESADAIRREIEQGKLPVYELQDLRADDATACKVCEAALKARLDDPLYRLGDSMAGNHMRSRETFGRFSRHLTELAERSNPETVDGILARLDARYMALRVGRKLGEPAPASAWLEVADGFIQLHSKRPDGGQPLTHAVELLRLGRMTPGVEAAELAKKEEEIDALARPLYPKEPRFRLLEFERRRGSQKELQALLTELEPLLGDEETLLRFYNETVELALKAKLRASFRTVQRKIQGGLIVEVPAGRDWVWSDVPQATLLAQYEVDGPLRRVFEFGSRPGTGEAEMNAAAQKLVAIAGEKLPDLRREPNLRKKKLNSAFGTSSWFEVEGKTKEGEPVQLEAWLVPGKARLYFLLTMTMGPRVKSDPVMRAILDGLHE
jgi:hypothetical protein